MNRKPQDRRVLIAIGAAVAAVTIGVFSSGIHGQMLFDDMRSIVANSDIQHFPEVISGSSRPFTEFTFFLNYMLHGPAVVPYHIVNVLIHALAALWLFGLLRRTLLLSHFKKRFEDTAPWLAGAVAMTWAVHPLQTESVTYIVQRAESMMGMFAALTLYSALRATTGEGRECRWRAIAVLSMALGMMSKPVMIVMPLLVLLFDMMFLSDGLRNTLRQRWRFHLLLAATWIIPAVLLSLPNESTGSVGFGAGRLSPWLYLFTQCDVIAHYLRLCVWPHPQCIDYAWVPVERLGDVWCTGIALLLLMATTIALVVRRRASGYLGCWFLLALAPTSSLIPLDDIAAEHRLYLALLAPLVLAIVGGYSLLSSAFGVARAKVLSALALVVLVGCFGVLTVRRNQCYGSEARMWQDVLKTRPDHLRARLGLGALALGQGAVDDAEQYFLDVLQRLPDAIAGTPSPTDTLYSLTKTNLGVVHEQRGQLDLAEAAFREALLISRKNTDARANLGIILSAKGQEDEAIPLWREVLEIEPHHAKARYCLGWSAARRGDVTAARMHLQDVAAGYGPLAEQAKAILNKLPENRRQSSRLGLDRPK